MLMKHHGNLIVRYVLPILCAICLSACEPVQDPPPQPVTEEAPEETSLWSHLGNSIVVAVAPNTSEAPDDELLSAMTKAREEADVQRQAWNLASKSERQRWAIKWAAPLAERDRVEYVWVFPESWSANRIEGILASAPLNELSCARTRGETVAFPAEELADWIRYLSDNPEGPYEGGYTVRLLIDRYGKPAK